jgi:hypothetical protein
MAFSDDSNAKMIELAPVRPYRETLSHVLMTIWSSILSARMCVYQLFESQIHASSDKLRINNAA